MIGGVLLYQLGMVYAFIRLATFWGAGRTRGIPDLLFLFLGLLLPIAGWLFSIFFPPLSLVLPLSLGLLWVLARRHRRREREAADAVREEQRAAAYAQLAADPGNAAACWSLGQVLEAEEKFEKALQHYERAHALSADAVDRHELEDSRQRLAGLLAIQRERARPRPWAERLLSWQALEGLFLALSVPLALESPVLALNLCGVMLFVRWFRA